MKSNRPGRSVRLAQITLATLLGAVLVSPAQAATSPIGSLAVVGSPFSPNGDHVRDTVSLRLTLGRATTLRVWVVSYEGATVRVLASSVARAAGSTAFTWNGRTSSGALAPDGPYTFRVTAADAAGTWSATSRWVTKAPYVPYPANPGAIVVAIDPGHGGPDPGATAADGSHEDTYNLDISRRLAAMLQGAGITVVMTHTVDAAVNRARSDLTGDRRVTIKDELQARVDVPDRARADLFLVLHNDASPYSGAHGTSTFCRSDRPWGSASCSLATLVQQETMRALGRYRSAFWAPVNRGVHWYDFYVLSPYVRLTLPRSSLMPAILAESLFVTNRGDLAKLRSASVRQAIATADFNAVARWLAARTYGARYEVLGGPAILDPGAPATYQVRITNRGMATLPAGSAIVATILPAQPFFDGRAERSPLATEIGRATLVDPLGRGASVTVDVPVTAPATGGNLTVFLGLTPAGGIALARRGVVAAQVPLLVNAPTPTPTPTPTPEPTPTPTPEPSPTPTPAPSP